jgi:ParB-like chromosome segregation protein Spo0J
MSLNDYKCLKADIEERGIQTPFIVREGTSQVICGIHRLRIAKELGIETAPVIYGTFKDEKDTLLYAINDNLARRQLTMEEKKSLARELLLLRGIVPAGRPKEGEIRPLTLKDIREKTGLSEKEVKKIRSDANKEKEELPKTVTKEKKNRFIEERIEKYGLSWGKKVEVDKTFAKITAESIEEKIRWILEDLNKGDRLDLAVHFVINRKEE